MSIAILVSRLRSAVVGVIIGIAAALLCRDDIMKKRRVTVYHLLIVVAAIVLAGTLGSYLEWLAGGH